MQTIDDGNGPHSVDVPRGVVSSAFRLVGRSPAHGFTNFASYPGVRWSLVDDVLGRASVGVVCLHASPITGRRRYCFGYFQDPS